jgi:signal transduction histidine kinase/DNA-binding response OmpR family regulator
MIASYGYRSSRKLPTSFLPGEGLVGQCALEKQRVWLTDVPRDYIQISSGLGAAPPSNIVVLPILFEQQVKAVIEIASLDRFTETHLSFLDQLMESIGVVLNTIEATSRTESLLMQSQLLAQELQQTNLELAEKARLLSDQNIEVERKNREVEQAKLALEEKASQLALSSKYKSEFLANMSHELRTPLNSLLILAQQLADNPGSNLTEKQVEYAKTIHGSGSDLLTLINDILDLSKIESGTVTLELSEYGFRAMRSYVERTFRHMAEAKQLEFMVDMANTLPAALTTDITRLQQILKNLLSNAFKFTSRGSVTLKVEFAPNGWSNDHPELSRANAVLAFSVIDSGVGIPQDKLQLIFEAFQQADGSTARKYGGTGLGLSISRELSRLLGGEIRVVSEVGVGSTFTLYLPYNSSVSASGQPMIAPFHRVEQSVVPYAMAAIASFESAELQVQQNTVRDDRTVTISGDASILIVEGNAQFASQLLDFARANRFKGVIAASGESVLMLARDYLPSAIFLSLSLPDVEGFKVLERLKRDPNTRNIPVYVMSSTNGLAKDELAAERERSLRLGAVSYLSRPFSAGRIDAELARIEELRSSSRRSVLVVEKNGGRTGALFAALKAEDVEAVPAETADEAMELLNRRRFHCMAVDMDLPEAETVYLFDELLKSERHSGMAIIASSTIDLSRKQTAALKRAAKSLLVRESHGPAQLNEIAALLLHRLPPVSEVKNAAGVPVPAVEDLAGRKVLIVDDDLRNIFALSSALERYKMQVLFAENGRDGIEVLEKNPDIEIVLMDIMMPEMDGYDTMRAIRRIPRFKTLPIITLTAKAMKGDRDKCIAAGASDYITKPVDIAQLISMMRVWMEERQDAA